MLSPKPGRHVRTTEKPDKSSREVVFDRRKYFRCLLLEALEDRRLLSADFGDAPAPYPTLLADDGARHEDQGPFFGAGRDVESDGQPTWNADGDDYDGNDDEDGVTFLPGYLVPGDDSATVEINMVDSTDSGWLNAWIDFNADGDWDDFGEQIFTDVELSKGTVASLSFAVPADAELGPTYARFRVSTERGLTYKGAAPDGEVEDYRVSIAVPPDPHGLFPGEQFPVPLHPKDVAAADLNGDGHLDLVMPSSVLFGYGNGVFAEYETFGVVQSHEVEVADLNHDGFLDVVTLSGLTRFAVLLGTGNGKLATPTYYDAGDGVAVLALADFNEDGNLDVVVANVRDRNVSVCLGNGDGTFQPQNTFPIGTYPWGPRAESIAVADLNGDGHIDIVTANDITDDVSVLMGHGDGTFAPYVTYPVERDPVSIAVADLNEDGWVDIVVVYAELRVGRRREWRWP
jgi:hypothetical protein